MSNDIICRCGDRIKSRIYIDTGALCEVCASRQDTALSDAQVRLRKVERERDAALHLLARIVSEQRELVLACESEWHELMDEARETITRTRMGAEVER